MSITEAMREFSRAMSNRIQPAWVQKERDRSLRGKARIEARRAARK